MLHKNFGSKALVSCIFFRVGRFVFYLRSTFFSSFFSLLTACYMSVRITPSVTSFFFCFCFSMVLVMLSFYDISPLGGLLSTVCV
ncbi:hypothetical protein J3F84DRAFT_356872 [Trichoderma pleuroticola]